MNYKRIYDQFIADRKAKEPSGFRGRNYRGRTSWSKRNGFSRAFHQHHVIPRALGGTDAPENIVALTHEDHFFAHLCLAHIYPSQWASVRYMAIAEVKRETKRGLFSQRRMSGVAVRKVAEMMSESQRGVPNSNFCGENNPRFDPTVYAFKNIDTGEVILARQGDFSKLICAKNGTVGMLVRREIKQTLGWCLDGVDVKKNPAGKKFSFKHIDGTEFFGTQSEFSKFSGVSVACVSLICKGKSRTNGWMCLDVDFVGTGRLCRTRSQIEKDNATAEAERQRAAVVDPEIAALHRISRNFARDRALVKRPLTFSRLIAALDGACSITQFKHKNKAIYNLLRFRGWLHILENRYGRKEIAKRVRCIEANVVFESIEAATRWAGLKNQTPIGMVCKGKRQKSAGYSWAYA